MDWRNDRIGSARRGENPTVLGELNSGFAVIGDPQFLPGYSLLLSKNSKVTALSELPRRERLDFLADVDLLATAVERACRSVDPGFRRVNIEVLGNMDDYVHAHIFPRYQWEPDDLPYRPVWHYDPANWSDPTTALSSAHDALRQCITDEITDLQAAEEA